MKIPQRSSELNKLLYPTFALQNYSLAESRRSWILRDDLSVRQNRSSRHPRASTSQNSVPSFCEILRFTNGKTCGTEFEQNSTAIESAKPIYSAARPFPLSRAKKWSHFSNVPLMSYETQNAKLFKVDRPLPCRSQKHWSTSNSEQSTISAGDQFDTCNLHSPSSKMTSL